MRVVPSLSRKVMRASGRRAGGMGFEGGKVRKTKVEGWRVVVKVERRVVRDFSPGDDREEAILDLWTWAGDGSEDGGIPAFRLSVLTICSASI